MLSNLTPAHEQGATIGVAQGAGSLARILGPMFATALLVYSPPLPYLICAAVLLGTTGPGRPTTVPGQPAQPAAMPQSPRSAHTAMRSCARNARLQSRAKSCHNAAKLSRSLLCLAPLAALAANSPKRRPPAQFEVTIGKAPAAAAKDGRLFVILAQTNNPEPRLTLGRTGLDAPRSPGARRQRFAPGAVAVLDQTAFAFPITNLSALPAGDYFAQALFDSNPDLRFAGSARATSTANRRRSTSTPRRAALGSWS